MMHTDVDLKATACLAEPMLLMSVLDNATPMRCTTGLNPVTFAFAAAYMVHGFILMSSIRHTTFRKRNAP